MLRKKFPAATFTGSPVLTELGFDLLNKLLTYDPNKVNSLKSFHIYEVQVGRKYWA